MGKTTILKALYNKMRDKFEGSAFILDTRARAAKSKSGLVELQKEILEKVLISTDYQGLSISNVDEGKSILSRRLRGIKSLIILDDVDARSHVEALYDPLYTMAPESVLLLSSRNHLILKACVGSVKDIFELECLDNRDSQRLFYWHAFRRPKPPPSLEEVSKKILKYGMRACVSSRKTQAIFLGS
ncbi:hypothetical protein KP509_1Z038500 [Ceratopteris richardii]|nr:hypothetical protein KP509_1Z038500 [Ceratopteris richardii]